jgi:nucleoside-diphosphate-sugar epimerase
MESLSAGKRWAVVGAERAAGRAVVRAASARGDEVVALLDPSRDGGDRAAIERSFAGFGGVTLAWVDRADDRALREAMAGCSVVAQLDVGDPWSTDRARCEREVLVRTEQVIDMAKRAGVARVILRSSERVTSSGEERRMVDESLPHSEAWLSPWDEMLSVSEGLVCAVGGTLEGVALRTGLLWGDDDDESLPRFRALAARKALVLPGGGDQSLCTTHADNLARGFLCAADAPASVAGNAYWVTDEERVTARRFFTRWLQAAGARGPRVGLLPFGISRWLTWLDGGQGMTAAELALAGVALSLDTRRVHEELGYAPVVTVDEGLRRLTRGGEGASMPGSASATR